MTTDSNRVQPRLKPARCQIGTSGYYWSTYQCIAEEAHQPEDVLHSEYWSHVASDRKLRPNDVFEVRNETGAWGIDVMVTETGGRHVMVRELRRIEVDAPTEAVGSLSSVKVAWKGPHNKHCVIRNSDGGVIKDGFSAKADAERYAREYEQRLAA